MSAPAPPATPARARALVAAARAAGLRIASAESCTGGLLGGAITAAPGASNAYEGGFITYSNAAKVALLGVRAESLAAHGAVSEEVAAEMAQGARERLRSDLAVSITGIAGPGPSEHKPEGRVCFGLAGPVGLHTETVEFGALGRDNVRARAVEHALGLLLGAAGG